MKAWAIINCQTRGICTLDLTPQNVDMSKVEGLAIYRSKAGARHEKGDDETIVRVEITILES